MTTAELINDVRILTESNIKDFPDADIQRHIDQEYYLWQQRATDDGQIQWTSTDNPDILNLSYPATTNFLNIPANMNILRVEAEINGVWVTLHKMNTQDYGQPERAHGPCTCFYSNICAACRSITEALEETGLPHYYIQTNAGLYIFPPHATDAVDVKVYYQGVHVLNWGAGDTPRLPEFSHRILSLQAALLYRDITDSTSLQFILSERSRIQAELEKYFRGKTKIRKMHFTKKSYL